MIAFIGVTVLMVLNLVIYHKVFNVIYFDLGQGLLKEIVGAYILALVEASIIVAIGQSLLGGIASVLGWILKVVLILGAVVAAVCVIAWIVKFIKEEMGEGSDGAYGLKMLPGGRTQGENVQNAGNVHKGTGYCAYCGKPMACDAVFCGSCGKEKWVRANDYQRDNNMGMILCPDCGEMVSNKAKSCPNCGCLSDFFIVNGEKGN